MKCNQCKNFALFMVGQDDQQVPLCLECHLKYVQLLDKQNEMMEREINYLTTSMEVTAGLPPFLPRYPERKTITSGGITLNNIKIDRSTIGVINTGNIESIDMSVTSLNQSGDNEIGKALKELSESILNNKEIEDKLKNQLIEIISVIAIESTAPEEKRRKSIIKPLIVELSNILSGVSSLTEIWENVKPIIETLFA